VWKREREREKGTPVRGWSSINTYAIFPRIINP